MKSPKNENIIELLFLQIQILLNKSFINKIIFINNLGQTMSKFSNSFIIMKKSRRYDLKKLCSISNQNLKKLLKIRTKTSNLKHFKHHQSINPLNFQQPSNLLSFLTISFPISQISFIII